MNKNVQISFEEDDNIFPSVGISFSIHLFIFCVVFAVNSILNKQFSKDDEKIIELNKKLQQSVRVDIVALPKFTVQELKKIPVLPQVKEDSNTVEVEKESIKEGPTDEGAGAGIDDLLGDLAKRDVLKKEKKGLKAKGKGKGKDKGKINSKDLRNLNKLVLEGNILNKSGTTALGEAGDGQTLSQFEEYVLSIPEQIRPYWKLPTYLLEKELNCRIRVFINSEGKIIKSILEQPSGVGEFDKRAMNSIKNTQFVLKPDKRFVTTLLTSGVVLGFPL